MLRRSLVRTVAYLLSLWLAAACWAGQRCVVLVSVDGLSASYLDNPRAWMPTLRKLARQGARAEGMVTSFPSVTWPSHVSLITGASPGRHGIIGNSVLDRRSGRQVTYIGDPEFTKQQCVRVPTLYDAAHAAGMRVGAIIWPACKGADSLDWAIPDSNRPEIHQKYTTPGLADELDAAGISIRKLGQWGWRKDYASIRDALYARVAGYLLRKHRPNLLLVHLITPDAIEHSYGPNTDQAYWAVHDADDRIRDLWDALQEPGLAEAATLFVVSDHGFASYDRYINPNVLLVQLGLVELDGEGKVTRRRAWCHSSGGSAGLYILDRSDLDRLRADLRTRLAKLEGVQRVLGPAEFARYGLPDPSENSQQPDLMLAARPGYAFSANPRAARLVTKLDHRRGAHGHLPDAPYMYAAFVAVGAAIKPGVRIGVISNLDVAPTIAHLLGLSLPTAEGRVLKEILK